MADTLSKETLLDYGFKIVVAKSKDLLTVFTKDKVEIVVVDDGTVVYSNMGFDYPLADLPHLKSFIKNCAVQN